MTTHQRSALRQFSGKSRGSTVTTSCSQGASSLVKEAECQEIKTLQEDKDIGKCVKHGGDRVLGMVPVTAAFM